MKYLTGQSKSLLMLFFTLPLANSGYSSDDTGDLSSTTSTDADGSSLINLTMMDDVLV